MNQVIKAFLGIYLVMSLTVISLGILGGFLTMSRAENLQSVIIAELEDSDFYPPVISRCFQAAGEQDCTLSLRLIDREGNSFTAASAAELPAELEDIAEAEITLGCLVEIPILGIRSERTLRSVAR